MRRDVRRDERWDESTSGRGERRQERGGGHNHLHREHRLERDHRQLPTQRREVERVLVAQRPVELGAEGVEHHVDLVDDCVLFRRDDASEYERAGVHRGRRKAWREEYTSGHLH